MQPRHSKVGYIYRKAHGKEDQRSRGKRGTDEDGMLCMDAVINGLEIDLKQG